jgi:hypothetical protein
VCNIYSAKEVITKKIIKNKSGLQGINKSYLMVKVALKVTPESNPATIGVWANLTIVF